MSSAVVQILPRAWFHVRGFILTDRGIIRFRGFFVSKFMFKQTTEEENKMELKSLGWNDFYKDNFSEYEKEGLIPGRVYLEHRNIYRIYTEKGDFQAEITGKLRFGAMSRSDFPAVGDWVAVRLIDNDTRGLIQAILPRKGSFTRKMAGLQTEEQVLAANVDTGFLVSGLDHDLNLRRIERFLTITWDSGARPVIILNKADLVDDLELYVNDVDEIACGAPIITLSAKNNEGIEQLYEYIDYGNTIVFLGSSGVGKSSIINRLMGEDVMYVNEVRESDSHGRHTTTHRQLLIMPQGGCVIDTPGLRAIQLWADEDDLSRTFEDIEELASQCKFRDCRHQGEPGCAIARALDDGKITEKRLESYFKQQREIEWLRKKQDVHERRKAERKWDQQIRSYFVERKRLRKKGLY